MMVDRQWFIFRDDHHLGPFSYDEMMEKIHRVELNGEDLLWRDGAKNWLPLKKWKEFEIPSEGESLPPEVPDFGEPPSEESEEKGEELPPPVPLACGPSSVERDLPSLPLSETSSSLEGPSSLSESSPSLEVSPLPLSRESLPPLLKFSMALSLGALGLLFSLFYFFFPSQEVSYKHATRFLGGLSAGDRRTIQSVGERPYERSSPLYRVRPSKDLTSLWFGSNYPYDALVRIKLKSKKGRLLGRGNVEMRSESSFSHFLAHFKKIEITKGQRIVPGEYEYEIFFFPRGVWEKWSQVFGREKEKASLKGTLLLVPYGKKYFEKKLQKFHQRIQRKVIRPLRERLQRYQTFLGLLGQIRLLYEKKVRKIKRGREISSFEKVYNRKIGPMYRDLIIDTNRIHLSFFNDDKKSSEDYFKLLQFGKEIGELASEMVTKTRTYKKISPQVSRQLVHFFEEKVGEIRRRGENQVEGLKFEIDSYQ